MPPCFPTPPEAHLAMDGLLTSPAASAYRDMAIERHDGGVGMAAGRRRRTGAVRQSGGRIDPQHRNGAMSQGSAGCGDDAAHRPPSAPHDALHPVHDIRCRTCQCTPLWSGLTMPGTLARTTVRRTRCSAPHRTVPHRTVAGFPLSAPLPTAGQFAAKGVCDIGLARSRQRCRPAQERGVRPCVLGPLSEVGSFREQFGPCVCAAGGRPGSRPVVSRIAVRSAPGAPG